MTTNEVCSVVRFGPFEADFGEGVLRKHGMRIGIQGKPLALLEILIRKQGRVASREELRNALWPDDVFVDFDKNLSTAMNKLRSVLNDSAGSPRYIETIPRRGYRFIATVELEDDASFIPPSIPPAEPPAQIAAKPSSRPRRYWLFGSGALLLAGLAGGTFWHFSNQSVRERDTIVVADIANSTGDAVFDDGLKAALQISLRQSPSIEVLSEKKVDGILQLMTRNAGAKLTPDLARDVCLRAGNKAYVTGAIGKLGSEYILELKAVNCTDNKTLFAERFGAASRDRVVSTLGRAATNLRLKLGESLATIQRFDVPLDQATTASLDALKAYSLGQRAAHEHGAAQSLPFDQQAIEADPNFAMAYEAVGVHYFNLGEPGRAAVYLKRAFDLRDRASEREKLKIEAGYYSSVTGQLDLATEAYRKTVTDYPGDIAAFNNLGIVLAEQGRYDEAAEITRQGLQKAPEEITLDENLVEYLLASQNFDEVRQVIKEAQPRKPDNYIFPAASYILGFLGSNPQTMSQQEEWFARTPNYENFGLALAANTAAYGGQLKQARTMTQKAVESAISADTRESGAIWQAISAQWEAAFGLRAEARESAMRAINLDRSSQGAEAEAALALALAGNGAQAESLAQDLNAQSSLDTQVQRIWLPTIEAQRALDRNDPAAALKILQTASGPQEFGILAFGANASGSCLYPTFLRGQAYLAAGEGSAAAVEFQKILDHGGLVWNCWTGSLARLGLARANALKAKKANGADADAARVRALSAYKDLLSCWEKADSAIPELRAAKAEYQKLLHETRDGHH